MSLNWWCSSLSLTSRIRTLSLTTLQSPRWFCSKILDPAYPRTTCPLDNEWTELAKKQLKGRNPEEALTWHTPEVTKDGWMSGHLKDSLFRVFQSNHYIQHMIQPV